MQGDKKLKYSGERGELLYEEARHKTIVDNYNLLYVALTRAVEQLYIITDVLPKPKNTMTNAILYADFIGYSSDQQTYSFGNPVRVSEKTTSTDEAKTNYQFISTSKAETNIQMVIDLPEKLNTKAMNYGNLVHQLMEKVVYANDLKPLENHLDYLIEEQDVKKQVQTIIEELISHEDLKEYYQEGYKVLNEQSILSADGLELIPDRVVLKNNEAVLIDYKTGKMHAKYVHQLNQYAKVYEDMGYKIKKKILVFINNEVEAVEL